MEDLNNSYFYCDVTLTDQNHIFLAELSEWANEKKKQVYVISKPLGELHEYNHDNSVVVLIPKNKITFIDFSGHLSQFEEFIDDFIDDLSALSKKFGYQDVIGRPREWRDKLICQLNDSPQVTVSTLFEQSCIEDATMIRHCELLISLLIGSINDPQKVGSDVPTTLLDKVKRKIILFDGDQTKFVYDEQDSKVIKIQGLSGAGKTELLLHKLKELYTKESQSKIAFTCHNKILAKSLRSRIPVFFDIMKVSLQIDWENRLFCSHAWGSMNGSNIGIYGYICKFYGIPYRAWNQVPNFGVACNQAFTYIKNNDLINSKGTLFDYLLIDESQDFSNDFFNLCDIITSNKVYIAGDIFQNIFERVKPESGLSFLLNKSYRTDPKTLMFAHMFSMGLFEDEILHWLSSTEWENCGYIINNVTSRGILEVRRDPIRRFEDIEEASNVESIAVIEMSNSDNSIIVENIINQIHSIKSSNDSVCPEDIGIILMDQSDYIYELATKLRIEVSRVFNWTSNIAYETKTKHEGQLFISNRNNVKGLEFPFVICVSKKIINTSSYRNTLYMSLTRSFIKSYLLLPKDRNQDIINLLKPKLEFLNQNGFLEIQIPSTEQVNKSTSTTSVIATSEQLYEDFINTIVDELSIDLDIDLMSKINLLESLPLDLKTKYKDMPRNKVITIVQNTFNSIKLMQD